MKHKITAILLAVMLCQILQLPTVMASSLIGDYIKVTAADGSTDMRLIDAYNSGRGSDQLIIYDADFGDSTMTNAFGVEVIVSGDAQTGGKVTSVENGVGNVAIPSDGFVISANGSARKWLEPLVSGGEGCKIEIMKNHLLTEEIKLSFELNAINPKGEYGGRGANQLVYYDKDCKLATTETNNYGYEAVVTEGIVTQISGNNSAIPQNGFVLSAHGSRKNELYEIPLGALVSVSGTTVTVLVNAQSAIEGARLKVNAAQTAYQKALAEFRDIDGDGAKAALDNANQLIEQAEALVKSKSITEAILTAQQAEKAADTANMLLSTSRVVEGRGIWHNPTETTVEQVAATLDKVKDAGLNMVFLQTVYWGYSIYPGSPTYRQFPQFEGFDLLQAFIDEGHKRGIEIHAWVHVLRATTVPNVDEGSMGYILDAHPNWVMKDRSGSIATQMDETSGYYFNPAHPEVRTFLKDTYTDLVKRYDIDGLQLDYIRFPMQGTANEPYEKGHSYDDYTISMVKRELGFNPLDITPEDTDKWAQWTKWRQDRVSEVVDMLVAEVKSANPDIIISADVVPEESGKEYKLQDWRSWVDKGLIELIAPMTYSLDTEYVRSTTEDFANMINSNSYIYVGVGPYLEGYDEVTLNTQVESLKTTSTLGTSMFSLNTMTKEELNLLGTGPFRKSALTPHSSPAESISMLSDDLKRKMSEIYIVGGGMTEEQADIISSMLDEVVRTANGVGKAEKVYGDTGERISEIKEYLAGPTAINAEAVKRINEDLDYMLTLSDAAANIVKGSSAGRGSIALKILALGESSEAPYALIVSDATMLPVNAVAEAMGAEVSVNDTKITITANNKSIDLQVGADYAIVNGEAVLLDAPVRSINGIIFVPMRFFTENLSCVITYNGQNGEINLKY